VTFVKTVMIEGYIKGCQYFGDCRFDDDSAVSQLSSAYGICGWGMDLCGLVRSQIVSCCEQFNLISYFVDRATWYNSC